MLGQSIDAYSAGTRPHGLNPLAVKVMAEVGVDISGHESKHLDTVNHITFDLIVSVCDNAVQSCPIPPKGSDIIHVPFDDPPQLAKDSKTEEDALQHYRQVRDEIQDFIFTLASRFSPKKME